MASMLGHCDEDEKNATAWQIDLLWMVAKSCTTKRMVETI